MGAPPSFLAFQARGEGGASQRSFPILNCLPLFPSVRLYSPSGVVLMDRGGYFDSAAWTVLLPLLASQARCWAEGRVPLFPGLSGQGRGGGQPAELSYFKLSSF